MISIEQAAAQGIAALRLPKWRERCDYLKIDIIDGKPGPWTHLYSALNEKDPYGILFMDMEYTSEEWVPHKGPLADSKEYKDDCEFHRVLRRT